MSSNPRYANGHRRRQLVARVKAEENFCALCGQAVDKTLHYLDPMAAVVDENVAVSRGGNPLSRANTGLMHRVCNSRKGVLTIAEYRAIFGGAATEQLHTSKEW